MLTCNKDTIKDVNKIGLKSFLLQSNTFQAVIIHNFIRPICHINMDLITAVLLLHKWIWPNISVISCPKKSKLAAHPAPLNCDLIHQTIDITSFCYSTKIAWYSCVLAPIQPPSIWRGRDWRYTQFLCQNSFRPQNQRRDLEARLEYLRNGPYNVVFHGVQPDWIEEEMADDIGQHCHLKLHFDIGARARSYRIRPRRRGYAKLG